MSEWTYPTYLQSFEESKVNAYAVYSYFSGRLTLEAICGLLGNMWRESHLSPVLHESGGGGYGLIQWTPKSALTTYCNNHGLDYTKGDVQLFVVEGEGKGISGLSGRWLPSIAPSQYRYTWEQFTQLTDIDTAVYTYLYCRERAGVAAIEERLEYARKYYEYLSGQPAPPPVPPITPGAFPPWLIPILGNLRKRKLLK